MPQQVRMQIAVLAMSGGSPVTEPSNVPSRQYRRLVTLFGR